MIQPTICKNLVRRFPAPVVHAVTDAQIGEIQIARCSELNTNGNPASRANDPMQEAGSLMKHLDPTDGVNLFAGGAPNLLAIRICVRRIACMHGVIKEPAGHHHALV
jgi:hypothetical protein